MFYCESCLFLSYGDVCGLEFVYVSHDSSILSVRFVSGRVRELVCKLFSYLLFGCGYLFVKLYGCVRDNGSVFVVKSA